MKAFGYAKKNPSEDGPLELKEVTIQATPKNLREVAAFIAKAADAMETMGKAYGHIHLRDSWEQWRGQYPDIIIAK